MINPPGTVDTITRQNREAVKVLVGGMLGMVVAMGIGRFVFTPILPLMQRDLDVSNTLAGWLAGFNYLGYLIGAVACSISPQLLRLRLVTGGALLFSLATTAGMGLTTSPAAWSLLRLLGGLSSAILFIVIAAEVGEALARRGHSHWGGALYSGIGIGIALSGLLVPSLERIGGWAFTWIGSGIVATLLAIIGVALGRRRELIAPLRIDTPTAAGRLSGLWILACAYFFEGLGYIVTATFLVTIVVSVPALAEFAPYSWVALGLAAVPSTILWPLAAHRFGSKWAIFAAYALQAVGIAVSIRADSVPTVLFGAITFGGTFLGIVAMSLAEGRRRTPDGRRATALLTASFSIGQMLGPVIAGILADLSGGFQLPLLIATGCIVSGGLLTLLDRGFHHQS